jgi:hypothetical protein
MMMALTKSLCRFVEGDPVLVTREIDVYSRKKYQKLFFKK